MTEHMTRLRSIAEANSNCCNNVFFSFLKFYQRYLQSVRNRFLPLSSSIFCNAYRVKISPLSLDDERYGEKEEYGNNLSHANILFKVVKIINLIHCSYSL